MTTRVSACATKSSSSTSLLSTIHRWPPSKARCVSINSSSATRTQPGPQMCRSRWISGRPVFAASWRENVLFPAPAMPVTTTRLFTALRQGSLSTTSLWLAITAQPEMTKLNSVPKALPPSPPRRRPLDNTIAEPALDRRAGRMRVALSHARWITQRNAMHTVHFDGRALSCSSYTHPAGISHEFSSCGAGVIGHWT